MEQARPIVLILLLALLASATYASSTAIYFKGGSVELEQPKIEIGQVYGIKVTPIDATIDSKQKDIYIPHMLENTSNTTNNGTIYASIKDDQPGWSVELISDGNGDGKHQWWENSPLAAKWRLGEGAVLRFFVKVKRGNEVKEGASCSVMIKVSSNNKDGLSYVGDNGIIYGGEDDAEFMDTVRIR